MTRRYEAYGTVRRSRSGVSSTVTVLAVIVTLVVAGVGGYALRGGSTTTSSASTVTSTSTVTTASTVMTDLAAAAEAECTPAMTTCLTILTTQDATNWASYYAPLFDQLYPWAAGKVDYVSLSSSAETTQVVSQYQAHDVTADLVTATLATVAPDYYAGALMNYTSPLIPFMNYSAGDYGPAWVSTNRAIVYMGYNPTLLPANEVPKNWSALANPIYNGKIAFQSAASLSITTAVFYYLYSTMGNSSGQWTKLMQGIAANHPIITSTAGAAEQDVLNGQAAICIGTFDDYVGFEKANASSPIKVADIEPMVYTPGVVAIANGAPHPAMAELAEAWFISVSGQTGVLRTNHDPYMASLDGPLVAYLPSDYDLVNAYANTEILNNTGAWGDTFHAIFGA